VDSQRAKVERRLFSEGDHAARKASSDPNMPSWRSNSVCSTLGALPDGTSNLATDVDERGQVVGISSNATSVHAVLWTRR
jgi:hypothetical protein